MLRNLRHVQLLRRLSLPKQLVAPPLVPDGVTATWWRSYRLESTTQEVTSQKQDESAASSKRQESRRYQGSRGPPKGKVLHSRKLNEDDKLEQEEMRMQLQSQQAEDDVFGSKVRLSSWSKQQRQQKERPRSKGANLTVKKRANVVKRQVEAKGGNAIVVDAEGGAEEWEDTFGTMADALDLKVKQQNRGQAESRESADLSEEVEDSDGEDDHIPLREKGLSGHTVFWYIRQIERLGRQGKVYEAIQMLEKTMLQEDRVAPSTHVFTSTIGICGRVGYTKKAFSLFAKMKKYGLEPVMPTYTALFNACANSPWREDGLARANRLLRQMSEKGVEPNAITLKGIVKAYGRLGELQTAFGLVDHMLGAGHGLDAEGWCHLLMACISDKDAGLKHAIEVWRWMRKRKTDFDLHHYNLLLRAVRDCGTGDAQFANNLIGGAKEQAIQSSQPRNPAGGSTDRAGSGGHQHKPWWEDEELTVHPQQTKSEQTTFESKTNTTQIVATEEAQSQSESPSLYSLSPNPTGISILDAQVPNILNPRGLWRRGGVDVLALGELDTAEKRLTLLGGVPGILSHMQRDGVKPDVRTFAMLLDMVPAEDEAEEDLLAAMTACKVKPDTDLLNHIIRRRCQRRSLESAKEVLLVFANLLEVPNLMTYASLALGCHNYKSGLQLLDDMEVAGFEPTTDIFGILMRRSGWDFRYKFALCHRMQAARVSPSKNIIETLETSVATGRRMLVQRERGEDVPYHFQRAKFPEEFRQFMTFYKPWLMKSPLEKEIHPWTQYRQPTGDADPEEETHNQ